MYQFSRSIYRELAPRLNRLESSDEARAAAKQRLCRACDATIDRLARDHRYFARPVRTLFGDVRDLFPLGEQVHVYIVIELYIERALEYIESLPDNVSADGTPRRCPANTRRGTPCQREPRPGREYCPSHRHLEETAEALAAVA